ncbi:chemotaxis protein CheA [Saccharospirillum salsuginis]|uniref:Chemotaxis protein CheA n=1 Tax=Saccharospirillum salsuginis TaxID=418750 RepID=A0A918K849_9GAMM|nr:chemotaxis protein CheA [Saccharospirillum salsuginis]GGX50842.1 chemotaxis protein CheA [Saccharospirillum salsuginis]
MGFEADEEILQDFLVEAGEILEQLSEQLIELERSPDDRDLLNAIFRGFHTVKGGAGFLQLTALVDCCHAAENVFDTLRNGHRQVDSDLMDTVLKALDSVNDMFATVSNGAMPEPADPDLLDWLHKYAEPQKPGEDLSASGSDDTDDSDGAEGAESEAAETPQAGEDITDSEFEELLDAISPEDQAKAADSTQPSSGQSAGDSTDSGGDEEISEDEFEALLDQLHGKGKFNPGAVGSESDQGDDKPVEDKADKKAGKPEQSAAEPDTSSDKGGDEITDDEFEALLDQLHGKGKFNAGAVGTTDSDSKPDQDAGKSESKPDTSQQKPADKPAEKPAEKAPADKKPEPAAKQAPAKKAEPAAKKAEPEADKPAAKVQQPDRPAASGGAQDTTVRVDTKRLDDIMNMVGELVLVRNRLVRLGSELESETLQKAVGNLNVVTADLQSSVMKTRMQPIKKVFGRFPRVVRDLARNMKKEVNLELIGEDTDLDKNLVDALADPLVHLVRNSVDHGVEMPDVREAAGKPRMGRVILSAEQEGDHILLTIRDDGGGMNPDKLREIAVNRGVMDQEAADRLSNKECYNLIFAPGFSTKTEISDISGRGVGMDVVKTKISQLNGTIDIDSEQGRGTTIKIKVPLTLAIMPTLMVMLEDQAFALPLVNVNEIFHLDLTRTNVVDGKEVVMVRGKPLPLYYLKRWLIRGTSHADVPEEGHVVVVSVGTQKVGFVVDTLIGQEEVVIKPLGQMLQGTEGMAGATITGDGRIALILDVPSLLKAYAGN